MECREIELTYKRAKKGSQLKTISNSQTVYDCACEFFAEGSIPLREYFYCAYCNRGGRLIGMMRVSEGGVSATTVDIKLVMAAALKCLASSIILIHNHPSGSLRPSVEDDRLTKKICEAAKLFDIRVNDHIIIGDEGYYSYADNGRI